MNADHDNFDTAQFDSAMRQLHRASLDQLQPSTLARLRAARHDALQPSRRRHGFGWGLASATAAVFALAIGLAWLRPDVQAPHTEVAIATPAVTPSDEGSVSDALLAAEVDAVMAAYGEDPDLYLWLAANDEALPPALER